MNIPRGWRNKTGDKPVLFGIEMSFKSGIGSSPHRKLLLASKPDRSKNNAKFTITDN